MAQREENDDPRSRNPFIQFMRDNHAMQGSRIIRHNLTSVFEENFRPLMQRPVPLITPGNAPYHWVQRPFGIPSTSNPSTSTDDLASSFVINMESDGRDSGGPSRPSRNMNINQSGAAHSADGSSASTLPIAEPNLNLAAGVADHLNFSPEANALITNVKKYLPFVLIIMAKTVYDYLRAILLFVGLYGTFAFYNKRLKTEIAQHNQRNIGFLLFAMAHLSVTIAFFYYLYDDLKLYLSLAFIPPHVQPLTVIDLLWLVAVTDFILKLITIIIKMLVTLIPHNWFDTKRRGKWYLAIESTSQLYRSIMPIQPWLYYLLEFYQGPQKVVGVFLSAAYMVSKGADLMSRARAWCSAMTKLLQNIQLGVNPDKDQLATAGMMCPICHDDYDTPVLLSCRHVFCENCVARWFDREQTCPLCRAKVVDDPVWQDGSTTHFAQLF